MLTPPVASMAANYEKILGRELYAPFQYVLKVGRDSGLCRHRCPRLHALPGLRMHACTHVCTFGRVVAGSGRLSGPDTSPVRRSGRLVCAALGPLL